MKNAQRNRFIAGVTIALSLGVVVYLVQSSRAIQARAAQIRVAAAEVSKGNLKALATGEGAVSPALLEAVGEIPLEQQPRAIQEAFEELSKAILGKTRQLQENPGFSWEYRKNLKDLLIVSGTRLAPRDAIWASKLEPHLSHRNAFLEDYLQSPGQLKRIEPAIKSALEMDDVPFVMALREKKLEIWGTSIIGDGAVTRITAIRQLIPYAQAEQDEQFRLKSFRFLGTHIARSLILDKGEPGIINQALVDLRSSLSSLQEGGLRYEVVLSVVSCGSGDECKAFIDRLDRALTDLRAVAKERQPILETTLKELFQSLTPDERRKVWEQILEEIGSAYLFTVEPTAWPAGLEPLPARMRGALSAGTKKPANRPAEVLGRLARLPIYETEMRYLLRATEARWARYRLIENCDGAITQIQKRSRALPVKNFGIISYRLLKTRTGSGFDWDSIPDSTAVLADEASRIYSRLALVRRSGWTYAPPAELTGELRATLLSQCRALAADAKPKPCALYE